VATGVRWTPLLGAFVGLGTIIRRSIHPAIHLGIGNFAQSTVTISKGSKLLLIDDGQFPHVLSNGTWVNNRPHPATEAGAPHVQILNVNGNSVEIGPFNTAGTFHLYCTIHPGMNLTIVVQ